MLLLLLLVLVLLLLLISQNAIACMYLIIVLRRYQKESDYDTWKHRLRICHLELEDLSSVDSFLRHCLAELPHLDILVNNAAQTIQRPKEYYSSLVQTEEETTTRLADESNILSLKRLSSSVQGKMIN